MAWFDVDEAIYAGNIGQKQLAARKLLKSRNEDFTGLDVCQDLEIAKSLWSVGDTAKNEIIALRSSRLIEIKGSFGCSQGDVDWLGYDIISLGHWSLLEAGMFFAPNYFSRWQSSLNESGLISSPSIMTDYVEAYNNAAAKRAVEDLPDAVYGIDAVEVGKLRDR